MFHQRMITATWPVELPKILLYFAFTIDIAIVFYLFVNQDTGSLLINNMCLSVNL